MLPEFIQNPDPNLYLTDNFIVIDMENTNMDKGSAVNKDNRLLYTSIFHSKKGYINIEGGEIELSNYLDIVYDADVVVAHNAKHEAQWLMRAGVNLSKILFYDTLLGEFVIAGNRQMKLDLDSVAARYDAPQKHNIIKILMDAGVCPSAMPQDLLYKYCQGDVLATLQVFLKQRQYLKKHKQLGLLYTKSLFVPVAAEMEMHGMHIDPELARQFHEEAITQHQKVLEKLRDITGGINMDSPQQVADFIYNKLKFKPLRNVYGKIILGKPNKRFPNGMPKTDAKTLDKLVAKTKRQKEFITLRLEENKLSKKISAYTRLFMRAIDNDCMIYGKINQSVARTHRLSSSAPNLQNIDRSLKKVISARKPEWKIRQNDYAQLEYRVAGFMAQCPVALKCINDNEDPHFLSASIIFGNRFLDAEGDARKEIRNQAKPHTFKPLYGGQSGTEQEKKYYKAFLEKHTGIAAWHERLLEEALETQKIVTPTGLVFYFPDTNYTNSGYVMNSTNIKNYPVQYLATGEIAIIGAVYLWHRMKYHNTNSFMINEVHDSVIIEEDPSETELMNQLSKQSMEDDVLFYLDEVYNIQYNFPLTIDMEINTNWGYDKNV